MLCQGKLKTLFANIWLKFAYKHARLSEILAQSHIFATWLSRCFTLQYRVGFFTVKGSFTNYVYKRRGVGTLQIFAGIYRDSVGVFCNICRENPVIFTDFPCNPYRLQELQGKPVDITGFSLQILQKNHAESL